MKFINSFDILKSDLQKSTTTRPFTIQGDADAVFDLKITNSAGKFYNFITGVFATNEITSTTSATSSATTATQVYITAANANIKIGMTVTGNGISENVLVINVNSQIITLNKNVEIDIGTTLKFSATAGLNAQALGNSGFYKNSIIFPAISSNDVYTVVLEASIANDTELTTEEIVYDTDSNSSTYGEDITEGFTNKLFKSIVINQYVDTTITINADSPSLTTLDADYSANTFTIARPRNYTSDSGFKTSFSWTFTTTNTSAITKSQTLVDTYFETTKTQTVNGATSSSRVVTLDAVDNLVVGMFISGTGFAGGDTILAIDVDNKNITFSGAARSVSDGITLTFIGKGSLGPSAYSTDLTFTNLTTTLTPLTVTVAAASSSSTALALTSAAFISEGSNTILKGIGIDIDETNINVASRPSGDLEFTEGGGAYNNDPTITHTADARIVAGLAVSGSGIPAGATIASITDTTHFELSVATTGGNKTGQTLTFNSNNIVLSSARTLEEGQILSVEGSSSAVTITGDVILTKMGDTNFTSTLQIDDFIGIGVA